MKNKKGGILSLSGEVIAIGFILAFAIFGYLLVSNLWGQDIIPPLQQAGLDFLETRGNDTNLVTFISNADEAYDSFGMNLDIVFLIIWLGSTFAFLILAYFLPPISSFNFVTILFIGIIIILLGLNYVEQVMSWFVTQFITNIFTASETNLPIFTWYITNYVYITIITIIMLLGINQFSRKAENEFDFSDEQSFEDNFEEENSFENESTLDEEGVKNV